MTLTPRHVRKTHRTKSLHSHLRKLSSDLSMQSCKHARAKWSAKNRCVNALPEHAFLRCWVHASPWQQHMMTKHWCSWTHKRSIRRDDVSFLQMLACQGAGDGINSHRSLGPGLYWSVCHAFPAWMLMWESGKGTAVPWCPQPLGLARASTSLEIKICLSSKQSWFLKLC